MKHHALALLDYVFLMRPVILIPGWVFLLLGYYSARSSVGHPAALWYPDGRLLLSLCIGTALMGAMYILNQICDRETDRLNRKLYLISEGRVPMAGAVIEMIALNAAALVLGWMFFSAGYVVLAAFSVLSGIAYSVHPWRLKGRAGWDIAANGLGFGGVAFLLGWVTAAPLEPVAMARVLPFVLAVGAVHTNATVLDFDGDRAGGDETIGVRLGVRRTLILGSLLAAASLIAALAVGDALTAVWAAASAAGFAWTAWGTHSSHTATANQLSGRAFVALQSLRFPYFLLWLAVVYLATKWYYRRHFDLDYPSLRDGRSVMTEGRVSS